MPLIGKTSWTNAHGQQDTSGDYNRTSALGSHARDSGSPRLKPQRLRVSTRHTNGIVNLGGGLATGMIGGLSAWMVEGAGLVGTGAPSYRGFRFPVEIISHGVWLYYRFPLSLREVQEVMLARDVMVSHETIRQWCVKFGQTYAKGLRHRQPRPGDKWHLRGVHQDQREDSLLMACG
jgi:hypothetical protein